MCLLSSRPDYPLLLRDVSALEIVIVVSILYANVTVGMFDFVGLPGCHIISPHISIDSTCRTSLNIYIYLLL